MKMLRARRRGFTLIELLIVISVIAILALIVVPKLMGAGRKAKEAALRGNLTQLRNAVEQFQSDTGEYPADLADLVAANQAAVSNGDDLPSNSYKGPYLTPKGGIGGDGLPLNPFSTATDDTVANHWKYTAGEVTVPDAMATDTTVDDGVAYGDL